MEWTTKKPEFTQDCVLATASQIGDQFEYNIFQIKEVGGFWGWYNGEGELYGDLEDLDANLYMVIEPPKTIMGREKFVMIKHKFGDNRYAARQWLLRQKELGKITNYQIAWNTQNKMTIEVKYPEGPLYVCDICGEIMYGQEMGGLMFHSECPKPTSPT